MDAATKAAAARDRHIEREQRAKAERAAERKRAKKAKERETRALKAKPRGPPGLQFATEREVAKPGQINCISVEDQARRPEAERAEDQQKREATTERGPMRAKPFDAQTQAMLRRQWEADWKRAYEEGERIIQESYRPTSG